MKARLLRLSILAAVVVYAALPSRATDRPLIFGINPTWGVWVNQPPETYDPAMYDKMQQAGCTSTRSGFDWCNMEPSPGVYVWEPYETRVNWAVSRGIEWVGLICTTPGWANETGQPDIYRPLESAAPYFQAWCTALARRFKGRVRYYEFWNEMDCCGGWKPVSNAAEYTRWLIRCYSALKAGDPDCLVSVGGYLGRDMGFLNNIYTYGGRNYFDAVAAHPYGGSGQGLPYFDQVHLENIHNVLVAHGDGHKPIWVTEYGWYVGPSQEQQQAQWLQSTLDLISQPTYDYVTIMCYHTISDFEPGATAGMGLCRVDLSPKPAYNIFKNYPKNTTPPVISNVTAASITSNSAIIRWTTDVPATSQVDYGVGTLDRSTVLDSTLVTQHSVQLSNLAASTTYNYRVRSSAAPYGEHVSQVHTFTTTAQLPQLLRNADFEDGFDYSYEDPPYTRARAKQWSFYGTDWWHDGADLGYVQHGSHSQAISTCWLLLHESVYQQVAAVPGDYYRFSAWTRTQTIGNTGPHLNRKVGIDTAGTANPDAASIVWSATSNTEGAWEKQSVIAQAQGGAITVHARCDGFKATEWTHVIVDNTTLERAIPCASASGAKALPDGTFVRISTLRVSALFSGCCYGQSLSDSSGIKLVASSLPAEGSLVSVIGTLGTASGERFITVAQITVLP